VNQIVAGQEAVGENITIRPFTASDGPAVRELFTTINRQLASPQNHAAFEQYITRSLAEEIDRIEVYYHSRRGGFWVATAATTVAGMFGLEVTADGVMESRRMYVHPMMRRKGVARQLLLFAQEECRRRRVSKLELSTSELQGTALQ